MNDHARSAGRRWVGFALALTLVLSLGLAGYDQVASAQADLPPLAQKMEIINDGYKNLRRAARSGAFDEETLSDVTKMQAATLEAKSLEPPMAAKLTGDAKAKMLNGYRKVMAKLLSELGALEVALRDSNVEAVKEHVTNLALIKKEGHDAFIEE